MKIHIVKKGDSLYFISQKYNVSLEEILQLNPGITNPDVLDVGMKLKIPSSHTAQNGVNGMMIMHQHVVKQGDTLWKLSKAWGVPLATMVHVNPHLKNPNVLLTGEVVNIPKADVAIPNSVTQQGHSNPGSQTGSFMQGVQGFVGKLSTAPIIGKTLTGYVTEKKNTAPIQENKPIAPIVTPVPPAPEPKPKAVVEPAKKEAEKKVEPIAEKVEPIAKKVEPLAEKKVEPLATKVDPIAKKVEPLAKKVEPLASNVEPYGGKIMPQAGGKTLPLSSNAAPYSSNVAPLSSNNVAPYTSNLAPLSSNNVAPYSSNVAPLSSNNVAPYSSNVAPLSSNNVAPYSSNLAPYSSNVAPYSSNVAPLSSNNVAPYSSNVAPNSNVGPLANTSPAAKVSPSGKKALPIEKPVEKKLKAIQSEYMQSVDLFQQYGTPSSEIMSLYDLPNYPDANYSNMMDPYYSAPNQAMPYGMNAESNLAPYSNMPHLNPYEASPNSYMMGYPSPALMPYGGAPDWGYGNVMYQGLGGNMPIEPLSNASNAGIVSPLSNASNAGIVSPLSNASNAGIVSPLSNASNAGIVSPLSNASNAGIVSPLSNASNAGIVSPMSNASNAGIVSPLSNASNAGIVSPLSNASNPGIISPYSYEPNANMSTHSAMYPTQGYDSYNQGYPPGYPPGYSPYTTYPTWGNNSAPVYDTKAGKGDCGCGGKREDDIIGGELTNSLISKGTSAKPKKKGKKAVVRTIAPRPKKKTTTSSRPWLNR
ncbi:LysM peptidoglycan-binding domain-containing protein [Paenibacillus sp. L3-i20]|uniref:LysM peptidoglycan-binding domain-containing protein n=1 Tax=Paenibacillus sp. L3-i20 TaxID=2905833 RepID=UPI001EDF507A|nr:LysM peptidoglycan-binding domain-containing protein [Paenibacillus sp. L3-i20]GKU75702.1 hypothetical protein L3i20_v200990 [Paenibacillus sp. L3-i20]